RRPSTPATEPLGEWASPTCATSSTSDLVIRTKGNNAGGLPLTLHAPGPTPRRSQVSDIDAHYAVGVVYKYLYNAFRKTLPSLIPWNFLPLAHLVLI
ncbi:MAG: hypothetical protein ABI277_13715, partial [Burkholderiaceae bacterium]